MKKNINKYLVISLVIPFLGQLGCGKREGGGGVDGGSTNIQNKGSDTMLQLAQAWSEMYSAKNPDVRVAVSGGGSGTGIAGRSTAWWTLLIAVARLSPRKRRKFRKSTV